MGFLLNIKLSNTILWLIFIGALYNSFGVLLQVIKPDISNGTDLISKAGVICGFLPLAIGLTWAAIEILFNRY